MAAQFLTKDQFYAVWTFGQREIADTEKNDSLVRDDTEIVALKAWDDNERRRRPSGGRPKIRDPPYLRMPILKFSEKVDFFGAFFIKLNNIIVWWNSKTCGHKGQMDKVPGTSAS